MEARVGIGQDHSKIRFKLPNVYRPFNHLPDNSEKCCPTTDTDDFTDGNVPWGDLNTSYRSGKLHGSHKNPKSVL